MTRVAALLAALGVVAASRAARADDWLGRDKALHFGASAGIAAGAYGLSSPWLERRWERAAVGAGVALAAGAAKEAWDATGRGDPSWKDATWDAVGTAVGVGVALLVDVLIARAAE